MDIEHYKIIKNDILSIRASWEKFLQLYGSEESVELLNFFSSQCFGFFQKSLNDSIILSILKLLDPYKQGGNNNLTLNTLVIEHKDTEIDSKLQTIYSKLKEESESLREYRNKKLAHQDHVTKLEDTTFLSIGKVIIENIFDLFQEFMHEIEDCNGIRKCNYKSMIFDINADCKSLLFKIEDYKKMKEFNRG
jgi:hypothetical protein